MSDSSKKHHEARDRFSSHFGKLRDIPKNNFPRPSVQVVRLNWPKNSTGVNNLAGRVFCSVRRRLDEGTEKKEIEVSARR